MVCNFNEMFRDTLCSDGYCGLSYRVVEERIDGAPLEKWLNMVVAPVELAAFIRGNT